MERQRPRRPAPHLRSLRQSPADRATPWSAGVLAGPRRTFAPSGSHLPPAPAHGAPASSPAYAAPSLPRAVTCRPRRPMERRRPRRPAPYRRSLGQSPADRAGPWSAGVLAGLRHTFTPSASHLPTAPAHGAPAFSPARAAPSLPQAVTCRPRRPMERRRPRRPAPHLHAAQAWSARPRMRPDRIECGANRLRRPSSGRCPEPLRTRSRPAASRPWCRWRSGNGSTVAGMAGPRAHLPGRRQPGTAPRASPRR